MLVHSGMASAHGSGTGASVDASIHNLELARWGRQLCRDMHRDSGVIDPLHLAALINAR